MFIAYGTRCASYFYQVSGSHDHPFVSYAFVWGWCGSFQIESNLFVTQNTDTNERSKPNSNVQTGVLIFDLSTSKLAAELQMPRTTVAPILDSFYIAFRLRVKTKSDWTNKGRQRAEKGRTIRSWMWLYTGTRYIVVDCGGGTVDITAHEMDSTRGDLHEIYKATGGPHGSVGLSVCICNRKASLKHSVYLAYAPSHSGRSRGARSPFISMTLFFSHCVDRDNNGII